MGINICLSIYYVIGNTISLNVLFELIVFLFLIKKFVFDFVQFKKISSI